MQIYFNIWKEYIMKKFGKFVLATLSVAAFAGGAYYFIKNFVNKDTADDFDDFEDDFDDFDLDEEKGQEGSEGTGEDRGYVTLNITEEILEEPEQADTSSEENTEDAEESTEESEKTE